MSGETAKFVEVLEHERITHSPQNKLVLDKCMLGDVLHRTCVNVQRAQHRLNLDEPGFHGCLHLFFHGSIIFLE
jgi:hypothetical protein